MKVHRNLDTIPLFRRAALTIGTFDGVHLGHQQIIRQLIAEASRVEGESVMITFAPHPRKVVRPDVKLEQLTTMEERISLLKKHGLDHLVIVPFTSAFSQLTAAQYVSDFLVARFNPAVIVIGYDHKFGKDRSGDFNLLQQYAPDNSFEVREIPEQLTRNAIVSSTRIRKALQEGDVSTANENLGYPYFFTGFVVEGNQLGRTIGFPTANLQMTDPDKLVPCKGVYAVKACLEGENRQLQGMMNIGNRPTVDGSQTVIEVHLFNFNEDIYGRHLRVELHAFLRQEQKFNGVAALKEQLLRDAVTSKQILAQPQQTTNHSY